MISFKCRRCMSLLTARDDQAGELLGCPNCGTRAAVPTPEQVQFAPMAGLSDSAAQAPQVGVDYAALPESADGGPLPELADDCYLDDSRYTPSRPAGFGTASLVLSLSALALVALSGVVKAADLLHRLLPNADRVARILGGMLPVIVVVLGGSAVGLGVRGASMRQPAAIIGVCLGIVAAALGVVLAIYNLFPE